MRLVLTIAAVALLAGCAPDAPADQDEGAREAAVRDKAQAIEAEADEAVAAAEARFENEADLLLNEAANAASEEPAPE